VKKFQVLLMAGVLLLAGCSTQANAQDVPAVGALPSISVIAPAVKTMKILTCCDSITVGGDGSSYRDELSVLLRQVGVEPVFVTAAVGGSACSMWAAMVGDFIKTNKPDMLLLNCGTNDVVSTNAQVKAFSGQYVSMIEYSRAMGVKVMVSKLQISRVAQHPHLAWLPGSEKKANVIIEKAARMYGDVGMADFSVIEASVENSTDGVHPSPAGELLYAKIWFSGGQRLGWW
jgi:lysophospholipase L1-like esterase